MKTGAILITAILAALCLPYFNSYAKSSAQEDEYEDADIRLTSEGGNYYIRPSVNNDNEFVVMLPLSDILYEYADISWDSGSRRVDITCGTLDVTLEIGSVSYVINGEQAELDAPPEIINGATYVPATFFEKTFGFWLTSTGEGVIDLFMPNYIIENI